MEQARFLCEEVGLDGFYIDEFSLFWVRSHDRWDGTTVDVNPRTGQRLPAGPIRAWLNSFYAPLCFGPGDALLMIRRVWPGVSGWCDCRRPVPPGKLPHENRRDRA